MRRGTTATKMAESTTTAQGKAGKLQIRKDSRWCEYQKKKRRKKKEREGEGEGEK